MLMTMRTTLAAGLVLLAASSALAEGPVAPPGGEPSPEEEIARLAVLISKGLRENEESLGRLARGQAGAPKAVDIDLPKSHSADCACSACSKKEGAPAPSGSRGEPQPGQPQPGPPRPGEGGGTRPGAGGEPAPSGTGGGAAGGGDRGLLRGSATQGREIASALDELLRQAGRMGQGPGGGGSGDGGDGRGGRDPKDSERKGGDQPNSGEKSDEPPEVKHGAKPPASDRDPPPEIDPKSVFFAKLPDKVREAVTNGDFDQVPEKYRDLIREWTKALSEKDRKQAEAAGGEGR